MQNKPFDPTIGFMFFGSWVESLERIKDTMGAEAAYKLFHAISDYSMYGTEPTFEDEPVLSIVWPLIERETQMSVSRRKSQFDKGSSNKKHKEIIITHQANPDLSCREIAELVGSSKSTVDRVIKQHDSTTPGNVSTDNDTDIDNDTDTDIDNGTDNDTDIDNGTGGRDSGTLMFYDEEMPY